MSRGLSIRHNLNVSPVGGIGFEKMNDLATVEGTSIIAQAADSKEEYFSGLTFPSGTALTARKYMQTYGVTEEMYGWVGECLLAAFAEAAGDAWTDEVAKSWAAAYDAIAGAMLAGARAAQSPHAA